jgi:spiro-SPASM protein
MKNLAVANALALSPHAFLPIAGGGSAVERAGEYAARLPGVEKVFFLVPEGFEQGAGRTLPRGERFALVPLPGLELPGLLERLQKLAAGYDSLFYFFADCPLLDAGLAARMLESHRRYFADYTFADGYPYGLSPEILKPSVLGPLLELARASGVAAASGAAAAEGAGGESAESARAPEPPLNAADRGALFELIKVDINAFDVETELSPVDLRLLRARLCTDSRRDTMLVERVLAAGAAEAGAVCTLLAERGELLRTLPAFFSVQVVAGCPQLCSYCPYGSQSLQHSGKEAEMPAERFRSLVEQVAAFCEDAVISVSLWGEPAYHDHFPEVAALVQDRGLRLIVETSGIGWREDSLAQLAQAGGPGPEWIVSLDAGTPELYRSLRGEGFEQALGGLQRLESFFPGRVYAQAVRMKENEEELERFYRHWKKETGHVIIQKYDHFCGLLPDRRVTDLSPLKRFPCWHLKRDVHVLLDGTVPLCREDFRCQHTLGNVFSEGLEQAWARGESFYRDHLQESYLPLCQACDEYYSFNF